MLYKNVYVYELVFEIEYFDRWSETLKDILSKNEPDIETIILYTIF